MEQELKIIIGENSHQTKVFVGEKQIGLIQRIIVRADAKTEETITEIIFPDLLSIAVHPESSMVKDLKENIALLKDRPNVKVTLEKLTFEDS